MNPHDPYWQHDLSLGDGVSSNEPRSIRIRLHVAPERYFGTREIVPLAHRTSVHARPYSRRPSGWLGTIIARVMRSPVPDMPYQDIGNCQGLVLPYGQAPYPLGLLFV